MTLSIESGEEISGEFVYVSGGAAVASGGVYEVKFGEYEKVVDAVPSISESYDANRKDKVYRLSNIISGNIVAVQAHSMQVTAASGTATSGIWMPCLSGEVTHISGVITVIADCI